MRTSRVRRLDRCSARASRQASTMARACGSRRCPAADRAAASPAVEQAGADFLFQARDAGRQVGWVTWQRSAASVKLPVSATARK